MKQTPFYIPPGAALAFIVFAAGLAFGHAEQTYLKASNTDREDEFGYSVSISGNTMVVGAPMERSRATGVNGNQTDNGADISGAAYVFVYDGTNWTQQAYLKASNTGDVDVFGWSVSISGDTIIVGAPNERSNAIGVNGNQNDNSLRSAGAAYIFARAGTNWSQQAYLKASNTDADDQFGRSVAVSGDIAVVGAFGEGSNATGVNGDETSNSSYGAGAAYVFVRYGTEWSQHAYLKASNTEQTLCCLPTDIFGYSVAVSGDTIVIGAAGEDSNATGANGDDSNNSISSSGAAYVFVRDQETWEWSQQAYLKPSNPGENDRFGQAVAISGDTIVVGAHFEDSNATGINGDQNNDNAPYSGAAYVFVREGTNWSQQAYLKASNTESHDQFGQAVAISADTIVVGARDEGSNARGMNGDQSNNAAPSSGAAYVFTRSGTTWSQQAYLKASNTDRGDTFGFATAISGDIAVIGAYPEASNATGVNGDQNNNQAGYAGAVYVLPGLGIGPQSTILGDGNGGYTVRFDGKQGIKYRLLRATEVTGPWISIAEVTPNSSGTVEFRDPAPPPARAFYRLANE